MGLSSLNNTLSLIGRLFDTRQATRPLYPDTSEKPPCHLSPIRAPLPRVTPEEVGIDSRHVAAFFEEMERDDTLNMHSLLLIRNGKVFAEAPIGSTDMRCAGHVFSASKSVTALAIGLLIGEGKLSLDTRICDVLDSRIPPLSRLTLRDLSVRHLLTMTSGASFNEFTSVTERDWVKGYLSGAFDLGKFSYNSLNTYMLSVILTEKTGQSLSEYLTPRLFEPLGITDFFWEKSPAGIEKGGWGLYIRPEDLAKLGVLVMQEGAWKGKQLISRKWIRAATKTQISAKDTPARFDYGYQFWTGRGQDCFLFNGILGQNVLGLRQNKIILVTYAGNNEIFQQSSYFPLAEKYFARSFPDTLPPNRTGEQILKRTLSSLREKEPEKENAPSRLRLPWRKKEAPASALPGECASLSGVRFDAGEEGAPGAGLLPVILQVVQNNYADGLRSLSFLESGDSFYMTYTEEKAGYFLPIGFTRSADGDIRYHGIPYHVKTRGEFTQNEDGVPLLKVTIRFSETPMTRILKVYYTGAHPYLEQSERPGSPFICSAVLDLKKDLISAPLIGDTVNLVEDDYLRYRIDKKFSPRIPLTPSKIITKHQNTKDD